MANQAIALQARAPQNDFMGRAIQQNAQFINMMSQQRAAERQAAVAQQEMELARAAEGRAVTKAELEARKANQDFVVAEVKRLVDRGAAVGDEAGYQMWLSQVEKVSPEDAALFRQYSPTFNPDKMNNILMGAEQYINKTIATPQSSFQVGSDLKTYSATVGGTRPGVRPLMVEGAPQEAPAGKPSAAPQSAFSATPARATDAQIDEAARKIINGAGIAELGIGAEDYDRATERANQMTAGGGRMQPISMTTGAQMGGQPDMAAVVQDMMSSKQISQSNLQLMREMAGPDKDAQLAQILKANNIQIVPDEQPGMRSAVFRPGQDAAPRMQLAQATNAPGTQFQVAKDPMQSPLPGSAQVPISRVREEAAAGRETPQEVYEKELARRRAERDALKQAGPKPLTPIQEAKLRENIAKDHKAAQATLDMMLAPDSGVIAAVDAVRKLSSEQKEAITGFSAYAPSVFPSSRSADTALKNLQGKVTQMGKSAASLSGSIGQMAVQEWKIVSDMIASLDVTSMEPADLDNQLDIIEATARRAAQTTRGAYENQYAEEFARYPGRFMLEEPKKIAVTPRKKAESALPRVRTDADWARLPPGTLYIAPNGETKRKRR